MKRNSRCRMRHVLPILWVLFLAICCVRCTHDELLPEKLPVPVEDREAVSMTLSVMVPGPSVAATRSLKEADECSLRQVDVFVFRVEGQQEYFAYHVAGVNIEDSEGTTKRFLVELKKSVEGELNRIVVIANAAAEVKDALAQATPGVTKEEMLGKIVFSTQQRWNTTSSAAFTPLPMWGEQSQPLKITGETTGEMLGTISLLRALARIDLGVNYSAGSFQGLGKTFRIRDVKVYNANALSTIAPAAANFDPKQLRVLRPTLASGTTVVKPALAYRHDVADFAFEREIYVGEADIKTKKNRDDRFCLVIGGYYTADGAVENTTAETWYRVDFFAGAPDSTSEEDIASNCYDILRNHRYRLNIRSVKGPGYDTEEEAFNSQPVNLETEILAWEEYDMNENTFDGQYQLTVDKGEVTLYEEGTLNPQLVKVFTDHALGWTAEVPEECKWVQVNPQKGTADTVQAITVKCDPYTSQKDPRDGWFWIKAGKLRKKILVHQLNESELSIEVTPLQLIFRKSSPNPKTITVTTFPGGREIFFSKVDGPNPIVWRTGGYPNSGAPNVTTYTFYPEVNNSGNLLNTLVTVYIQDASGRIVSRTVSVRQLATDLLFNVDLTNPYPSGGGDCVFSVESDANWSMKSVSGDTSILDSQLDTSEHPGGTRVEYHFSLKENNSWMEKNVSYTPTSTDPDFYADPIVVRQAAPVPSLILSEQQLTFGEQATTASVSVTTNAKWKYSTSGDWEKLGLTVSPGAGNAQGSHKYNTTYSAAANFKASAIEAKKGTPAAGDFRGKALFTTVDHGDLPVATAELSVTRTVSELFTNPRLASTSIPRTGGMVTAYASTNTSWSMGLRGSGMSPVAQTDARVFDEYSLAYKVGENATWNSKTYQFDLAYGADKKSGGTLTATQTGYHIDNIKGEIFKSSLDGPAVADAGKVTVKGAYPAIPIQMWSGNTEVGSLRSVPKSETGSSATVNLTANTTWNDRTVDLWYRDPRNNNNWVKLATATQSGYGIKLPSNYYSWVEDVSNSANYLKVLFSGYIPDTRFRVTDFNGSFSYEYVEPARTWSDGQKGVTLNVGFFYEHKPGETTYRTLLWGYYHPITQKWTYSTILQPDDRKLDIGKERPDAGNYKIRVAKNLATANTWAELGGWPSDWNTKKIASSERRYWYGQTHLTGGRGSPDYEEDGLKGWRVPNGVEAGLILKYWADERMKGVSGYMLATTDNTEKSTFLWAYVWAGGQTANSYRGWKSGSDTNGVYTICVRDMEFDSTPVMETGH